VWFSGRRGYRQLRRGSVRKRVSCQRYTAVTTATTARPVLILGGGGWGRSKVCNMLKEEEKQTAKLCFSITTQFVQASPPEGATVLERGGVFWELV